MPPPEGTKMGKFPVSVLFLLAVVLPVLLTACAGRETRIMEATAYCSCGQCCSWERGSWKYLKLDFWNRYVSAGPDEGRSYSGHTASGAAPVEPVPGLFSLDSLVNPWLIPVRTVFPWLWMQQDGTIAADTAYYPFGTRMYVPGWGWGVVTDKGSAITGPDRIDLYFESHLDALEWGRRRLRVEVER